MELEITTPHESYPDEATEMVRERVATLERVSDGPKHVRAVLDRLRGLHRVELVATSWGRTVHRVETSADTLLSAVNEAVHRLERALRRRDEKHRDQQRRAGGAA